MEQRIRESKKREALSRMKKEGIRNLCLGIAGIAGLLILWDMVARFGIIPKNLIVSPWEVVKTLAVKMRDTKPEGSLLLAHITSSLIVALSGYALALLIGIPLGLLMGWYKAMDRLIGPVFEVLRPVPPIAWIPFTIIFLGSLQE